MDNTQYAKELFDVIKSNPIPGVEKRMKHKENDLRKTRRYGDYVTDKQTK